MAYSFIPPGNGSFGGTFGGYGSLGMGQGLVNAMGTGLNLAQAFRKYQNDNILDQYRIPAQAAEATNQMWNSDFDTARTQAASIGQNQEIMTPAAPGPVVDANGNLVSHPVGAGTNQTGAPYAGTQAFMGQVQNNVVNGMYPQGNVNPNAVLSQYLTTPVNNQQQALDPRYLINGR